MNQIWLTVNDLKQYLYCPRVVYFNTVVPVQRKTTYKMQCGQLSQEELEKLETRRTFKKYGIDEGRRLFNLYLQSPGLALSGKLDCLLICNSGEYIPLDYKDSTSGPRDNHFIQLAAYGLLVEKAYQTVVTRGIIYSIPQTKIYHLDITPQLKDNVTIILSEIKQMITRQSMPEKVKQQAKCVDCEFRNFCGDVF